jgi:hypothetical protein
MALCTAEIPRDAQIRNEAFSEAAPRVQPRAIEHRRPGKHSTSELWAAE